MKNIIKISIIAMLAVLATACSKPEKQALEGTWQWTCTSGGLDGNIFTPETVGFNVEIVFKNNRFTFYKDGKKITSCAYRIDKEVTSTGSISDFGNSSFFTLYLPEKHCEKIRDATWGAVAIFPKSPAAVKSSGNVEELLLYYILSDGYCYNFVKQ